MDLSRYMAAFNNETLSSVFITIKVVRNVQSCFVEKFQSDSYLISWLLTFVDDMFDGNMAVLVKFHNFHLTLAGQKLDCGQMF